VFGTQMTAPDPFEILTALEKPDLQAVVCLAAVPQAKRAAFFDRLNLELRRLREKTGRPHWLVIDEAQELVPKAGSGIAEARAPAENTIYVTTDPGAIAIRILATVEVVAARGASAGASLEAFAAAVAAAKPPGALRSPGEHQALV